MRLSAPRIPALAPEQWSDKAREIMQPFVDSGRDYNVFRTLMNHPDLAKRWLVFASHILVQSSLPERERELLILRIGHLCRADYEWQKHADISRFLGMSEAAIESSKTGPDTPGLSELDRLLLQATQVPVAAAAIPPPGPARRQPAAARAASRCQLRSCLLPD